MRQIGRYQIEGEIGRGGMGVVYRAFDPALSRAVAVKVIRLSEVGEPEQRAELHKRLVREARSAGMLAHPNIVTVYDLVQEDELTCIVMEFVEGRTLAVILGSGHSLGNAMVLSLLRQVGAALDYAHARGVVHRDVKPSNLIVQAGGAVKIADFGVARISTTLHFTKSGTVLGTPYYMSPEQVQGKPLDGRADQFSLAVTAYEILTGQRPFNADTLTTLLYKIVNADPLPPETLNATLGARVGSALRKALSKDPEARYASCHDFVEALERACSAAKGWRVPTSTEQPAAQAASLPGAPRRWRLVAGVGLVTVALAGVGYFAFLKPVGHRELARVEATPSETATAETKPPAPPPEKAPVAVPAPPPKPPDAPEKRSPPKPASTTPPKPAAEAKPAPSPTPAEAQPTALLPPVDYSGPASGSLVWTGQLEENSQLTIDGRSASAGAVSSELPGVPVKIQLWPSSATLIEVPGPQNRWKRLVIGSGDRKQLRIIIRWEIVR